MSKERILTIHFNDGTSLSLAFPKQAEDPYQISSKIREALQSKQLAIEVDGELFAFPTDSVKYFQLNPVPEKLPENVIKGGSIL